MEGLHYPYSENKGADQLRGYREADLRLYFRICKKPVFSGRGSNCGYHGTCLKRSLECLKDRWLLHAVRNYCRMLPAFCNTFDLHYLANTNLEKTIFRLFSVIEIAPPPQ